MSTRETYKIYDDYMDDYFYFYVQSDNYPEGAAEKFKKMLQMIDNKPYGYAAGFFRANEAARFTKGHDYYGDTEYLYDIVCLEDSQGERTGYKLIAKKIEYQRETGKITMTVFFEGAIEDFIKQYTEHKEVRPTEIYIINWEDPEGAWTGDLSFLSYEAAEQYAEKELCKDDHIIFDYKIIKTCVKQESV